jgi:hypothetical protein
MSQSQAPKCKTGALMFAYIPVVLLAGTPLVLGLVALFRGRREDIPSILRALARWGRK